MTAISKKRRQSRKKKRLDSTNEETVMQCQSQEPIWKIVADIGSQIPMAKWDKVPDDASINFKHYLYGETQKERMNAVFADAGYWNTRLRTGRFFIS